MQCFLMQTRSQFMTSTESKVSSKVEEEVQTSKVLVILVDSQVDLEEVKEWEEVLLLLKQMRFLRTSLEERILLLISSTMMASGWVWVWEEERNKEVRRKEEILLACLMTMMTISLVVVLVEDLVALQCSLRCRWVEEVVALANFSHTLPQVEWGEA